MISRALSLAVLALVVAGCGGGGGDGRAATPTPTPAISLEERAATPDPRVDQADLRIVRDWADTLRNGDVAGAAAFFAIPSRVSNGTPPIRLKTRAEVRFFNRTLTCGAMVIGAKPAPHRFLLVTFRLTERPGRGECGQGAGGTARTAFRIRNGLITDWLRVPDAAEPSDAQAS